MSSYAVFLRESNQLLSTVTDEFLEEKRFPIAVPHSRPRGTWGEWMKEITIPKEVLDSLVRRYDSTSWSATGGKSSTAANDDDARTVPAAGAWRRKPVLPQEPRDVSKEGGAMRGVCGAAAARSRPKSSGRARALRLRSESSLEYQRPGQNGRLSFSAANLPGSCKQESTPLRHDGSASSDWPPVGALPHCGAMGRRSGREFVNGGGGGGRSEEMRGGQWQGCEHEEEREEVDVEVLEEREGEGEGVGKEGESHESGLQDMLRIEERVSVLACGGGGDEDREDVVGGGGCDYVTGSGEGDQVIGEDNSVMGGCEGGLVQEECDRDLITWETESVEEKDVTDFLTEKRAEDEECDGHGSELAGVEGEGQRDVVRMKCGCTLDCLESHTCMTGGIRSRCWSKCGGRADPEVPPWANDDHTLVFSNIPTHVSEEELEENILPFGDVTNCAILTIPNEAGLNTAYVRMKERESCQWVISCFDGIPYDSGGSEPMACYYVAA